MTNKNQYKFSKKLVPNKILYWAPFCDLIIKKIEGRLKKKKKKGSNSSIMIRETYFDLP